MSPEQFKKHRKTLGLTQRELSQVLGLSAKNGHTYISKIERGVSKPSWLLTNQIELLIELNKIKNND